MAGADKDSVHVAVAILLNRQQQLLIAKRADHLHQGGLWEFPGGKVGEHETARDALNRECGEEVGLTIVSAEAFLKIHHDYGDKKVILDVWLSRNFSGKAQGREGQPIRWVTLKDLDWYQFPKANLAIIEKLRAWSRSSLGALTIT